MQDVQTDFEIAAQAGSGLRDNSSWSNKRKSSLGLLDADDCRHGQNTSKKAKTEAEDCEELQPCSPRQHPFPPEIWQRIFTFVSPQSLGKLLRVNRFFHICLDPRSCFNHGKPLSSAACILKPLKPDTIWQLSRRLFWPRLPNPLKDYSELDMWRICCSLVCQQCGATKLGPRRQRDSDPWHSGPGLDGLATVFAFGVTCCGPCLVNNSVKEIDILLSSTTPSSLIPALPFVFITSKLHAVSPSALAFSSDATPPELTKLYWSRSIDAAKAELQLAQGLGLAAFEEWMKGLEARGDELRSDAARWERWAAAGGLVLMKDSLATKSENTAKETSILAPTPDGSQTATSCEALNISVPPPPERNAALQGTADRTAEEAATMKALRRADIERRAMTIAPPLPPNLLIHMPSFQAAIQIASPLDDHAWELLKPRLLLQREDAELQASEKSADVRALSTKSSKPAPKEVSDKDWDDIQGPVRAKMANYADEIIRNIWAKGRKVNKENSPRFAAEVLLSVRTRFYADVEEEAAAAVAAGRQPRVDPPRGPFTQKLTLENMKWVFDMKIKHHTEAHRKELFLCNGCDSNRYYGFEGVIQHYAAKHTTALSCGNVVVHWRAEWPKQSPFKSTPRTSKQSHQGQSHGHHHTMAGNPSHRAYGQSYPSGNAPPLPPVHPFSAGFVPPPPPIYHHQQPDPYGLPPSCPGDGHFPPTPHHPPGYEAPQAYLPGPNGFGPHASSGPSDYPTTVSTAYGAAGFQGNPQPQYSMPLHQSMYQTHLEHLVRDARDVWNHLCRVKDLHGALKVQVTIHHVVKRFRFKFSETPTLRLFNDGLSNNKDMRPVRNVNGLICRACKLGLGNALYVNPDRSTFSLPQLVNHFENRHLGFVAVEPSKGTSMDWTKDMVLLPEMHEIGNVKAPSRSHHFSLIHEAVPWVFDGPEFPLQRPQMPHLPTAAPASDSSYNHTGHGHQYSAEVALGGGSWRAAEHHAQRLTDMQQEHDHQNKTMPLVCERAMTPHRKSRFQSHHESEMTQRTGRRHIEIFSPRPWLDEVPPAHGSTPQEQPLHESGDRGAKQWFQGHLTSGHRCDHGSISDEAQSSLGERTWDQPRAEQITTRHAKVDTRLYPESGRAASIMPHTAPSQASLLPREISCGLADNVAAGTHPEGPLQDESRDYSLTAGLESHLRRDNGDPVRPREVETWSREPARAWRPATYDADAITRHNRLREVGIVNDSRNRLLGRDRHDDYLHEGSARGRYAADTRGGLAANEPAVAMSDYVGDRRDGASLYSGGIRVPSWRYEKAYEIVHVRDANGEYIIRRPVLRECEPPRVLYEDDPRAGPEREDYQYEHRGTIYDSVSHDAKPATWARPGQAREPSAIPCRAVANPSVYEEYGPRNPNAVSLLATARDLEY